MLVHFKCKTARRRRVPDWLQRESLYVFHNTFRTRLNSLFFAAIAQCREILARCGNAQVQFQASCALKSAFPRDCLDTTQEALMQLIVSILEMIGSSGCSNQVREQLVAIVAIAAKRITGQFKNAEGIEIVQQRVKSFSTIGTDCIRRKRNASKTKFDAFLFRCISLSTLPIGTSTMFSFESNFWWKSFCEVVLDKRFL